MRIYMGKGYQEKGEGWNGERKIMGEGIGDKKWFKFHLVWPCKYKMREIYRSPIFPLEMTRNECIQVVISVII